MGLWVGMGLLSLLVGLSVNLTEDCDEFASLGGELVELGGAPGRGLGALGQCLNVALLPPIGHDGSNTGGRKCCGEECFFGQLFADPLGLLKDLECRELEPRLRGVDCECCIPAGLGVGESGAGGGGR